MISGGNKQAFYAVVAGRIPGVYLSWQECKDQIQNFPGAKHKKFYSAMEAEDYVNTLNHTPTIPKRTLDLPPAAIGSSSRASPQRAPAAVERRDATTTTTMISVNGHSNKSPTRAAPASRPPVKASTSSTTIVHHINKPTPSSVGQMKNEADAHIVYSDGACKGNGQAGSVAGIGVWWGPNDERNIVERCPGDQTNNRAELIAIVRVLETAPLDKRPIIIKTDSKYSKQCISDWMPKWMSNNWRTAKGEPVKNVGIIKYLAALLDERGRLGQKVELEHVYGHRGEVGNEGADALANRGCLLPPKPEQDWLALEKTVKDGNLAVVLSGDALADILPKIPAANKAVVADVQMTEEELREYADALLPEEEVEAEYKAELEAYAACLVDDDELERELAEG